MLFTRRMVICVFTGFSSGLPLYVLLTLVPAWLRSENVNLTAIGLFTLIQFPYTWKFLWSPLLDRFAVPLLGRRRGWMLLTQCALLLWISLFGTQVPGTDLWPIALLAGITAFLSASQDIVLDAYRREILQDVELGLGTAVHVNAYKIAGLIPGSLSLVLADISPLAHCIRHHRAVHAAGDCNDVERARAVDSGWSSAHASRSDCRAVRRVHHARWLERSRCWYWRFFSSTSLVTAWRQRSPRRFIWTWVLANRRSA